MKTKRIVGQSKLRGALSKYKTRFNLLELRAEQGRVPGLALLCRWTEEVESNFVFSVMVSQHVGRFDQGHEAALRLGQRNGHRLERQMDCRSNRSRHRSVAAKPAATARPICSTNARRASRGVGTARNLARARCSRLDERTWRAPGVTDITRGDLLNEPVIYSRLPGLGTAARMTAGALENAAACLVHAKVVYVVVCGDGAGKASKLLRRLIADDVHEVGSRDGAPRAVRAHRQVFGRRR